MPSNVTITLNGKKIEFPENTSIIEIIDFLNPESKFVAVEQNGEILAKEDFSEKKITENDIIEVIQPLGGG